MVWAVAALPVFSVLEWEHQRIPVGGKGRGFLTHNQSSGGIVGRALPTKVGSRFPSFIPGHQRLLVYTRSSTSSCLYQVIQRFLVHTRGSELFTPVAGVWWALLGPVQCRWAVPGPFVWVAPGRPRSTPMGGLWAASTLQPSRLRNVHDRGRPFSTANGSSFRRGSVYLQLHIRTSSTRIRAVQDLTLSLQRSSFLSVDQSMISFRLNAQRAIQRRSLDEIAEGQVRRGQIWRRSLDEIYWCNPAGCLAVPVYINPGIQGGLGQIGVLSSDWSRIWDAVDAVGARRSGDAPLGYSSLTRCFQAGFQWAVNYHWLLTSAGSLSQPPGMQNYDWPLTQTGSLSQCFGMPNFYWLTVHTESCFQPSRTENSDWSLTQTASPFVCVAVTSVESCGGRPEAAYFLCWCRDLLKGHGRSGRRGIEREEERGHRPNSNTSRTRVGSHHPLVRPHAVPGVWENTGGSQMNGGRFHWTVATTRLPLAWSAVSVSGLGEWYVPGVQNGRMGPPFWAVHPLTA